MVLPIESTVSPVYAAPAGSGVTVRPLLRVALEALYRSLLSVSGTIPLAVGIDIVPLK